MGVAPQANTELKNWLKSSKQEVPNFCASQQCPKILLACLKESISAKEPPLFYLPSLESPKIADVRQKEHGIEAVACRDVISDSINFVSPPSSSILPISVLRAVLTLEILESEP